MPATVTSGPASLLVDPENRGPGEISARVARPDRAWFDCAEAILRTGKLKVRGRISRSSNNALLVEVDAPGGPVLAVYKPARLARPLWDFDAESLHKRELAAYVVAKELGWRFVPPTVIRDGPQGEGALQLHISPDGGRHYFEFADQPHYAQELMRICAFDVVVNNADRKAGHCILDSRGCVWSLDHGTCFHTEDKLRSVIWEFGGVSIPDSVMADLKELGSRAEGTEDASPSAPWDELQSLLDAAEIDALRDRIVAIVEAGTFPEPGPLPPIPWPPI